MGIFQNLPRINSAIRLIIVTLVSLVGIYFFVSYVIGFLKIEKDAAAPCMEGSPQAICYKMPEDVCVKAWVSFEPICKEEIAALTGGISPSQLIGPAMLKCQKQKLEKILHYSRQNSASPICIEYFRGL